VVTLWNEISMRVWVIMPAHAFLLSWRPKAGAVSSNTVPKSRRLTENFTLTVQPNTNICGGVLLALSLGTPPQIVPKKTTHTA